MQPLRQDRILPDVPSHAALHQVGLSSNSPPRSTVRMLDTCIGHHRRVRRVESMRMLAHESGGMHDDVPVTRQEFPRTALDPSQNRLLAALEADAYADLLPHLELVALPERWAVCEAGAALEHVYFPVRGIVSFLYESANGTSVEVGFAGNDGLVGIHLLMGGSCPTSRAVVRNSGHAYRLRANVLKAKFESCPALRQPLLRYAQALIAQTTQTAVCHCHHRVEQQFVRLLLSTIDRLGSNELELTHDATASLLGVRRESVTAVAGRLQNAGLIHYHRGRITVLNRPRLTAAACECYAAMRDELDRLFPLRHATGQPAAPIAQRRPYAVAAAAGIIFAGARRHAPARHGASPI